MKEIIKLCSYIFFAFLTCKLKNYLRGGVEGEETQRERALMYQFPPEMLLTVLDRRQAVKSGLPCGWHQLKYLNHHYCLPEAVSV